MSLFLLAPIGLLGLVAWLLPVLLHLTRREEHRITPFAALRWLAGPAHAQRRLRIERPWLLLLRLLLLAVCAILLAQPLLRGEWRRSGDWVVAVPGVDLSTARVLLPNPDASWHWLAPDFPDVEESIVPEKFPSASLLRELDTNLPPDAALTVVAPAQIGGLDGERIRLSRAVEWKIVQESHLPTPAAAELAPIHVAVRYDAASEPALRYVRATLTAWNIQEPGRYLVDMQTAEHPIGAATTWLLSLGSDEPAGVDAWMHQGGVALFAGGHGDAADPVVWRDDRGMGVASSAARGSGRRIDLIAPLEPARLPALLDANFPQRVLELMRGSAPAPDRALAAADLTGTDASRATPAALPLDRMLIALVAALFLLERLVAARRRRSPA